VRSTCAGLSSQQWERKKATAKSVQKLCEEGADALGPSAATICAALLQVTRCVLPHSNRTMACLCTNPAKRGPGVPGIL